jgi:hypothetical protein
MFIALQMDTLHKLHIQGAKGAKAGVGIELLYSYFSDLMTFFGLYIDQVYALRCWFHIYSEGFIIDTLGHHFLTIAADFETSLVTADACTVSIF